MDPSHAAIYSIHLPTRARSTTPVRSVKRIRPVSVRYLEKAFWNKRRKILSLSQRLARKEQLAGPSGMSTSTGDGDAAARSSSYCGSCCTHVTIAPTCHWTTDGLAGSATRPVVVFGEGHEPEPRALTDFSVFLVDRTNNLPPIMHIISPEREREAKEEEKSSANGIKVLPL